MVSSPSYYFTLAKGQDSSRDLYVAQKGVEFVFKLDPSLISENVRIFTNFPPEGQYFDREQFYELKWECSNTGHPLACFDRQSEKIVFNLPGNFEFFFTIDGTDEKENANGKGFIVVQPNLVSKQNSDPLPMTGICMQTYLAKLLGPFKTNWKDTLDAAVEAGYNFIHLTPLQELGSSESAYSLMSRERLNPNFESTWEEVGNFIDKLNSEHGVFTITDLVLNHTANETDWLLTHPETTYNLDNSPHLKAAYLLDRLFHWFSVHVSEGRWTARGIPPEISEDYQLETIRNVLFDLVKGIAVHELYMANVDNEVSKFRKKLQDALENQNNNSVYKVSLFPGSVQLIPHRHANRFEATVDFDASLFHMGVDLSSEAAKDNRQKELFIDQLVDKFRVLVDHLNRDKRSEINEHVVQAVNNYIENIRYRFVAHHGPRLGRVTLRDPLAYNYFIKIGDKQGSNLSEDEAYAFDVDECKFIMAHNGWVMGDDPLRNFAEPGSWVYLRRELIPWGDSCKLRFGQSYDDCPFLWEHFKKNAEDTAKYFHGVRLDNCHSTPLHVAEYVLDAARRVRPDLLVVAELFTSSEKVDNFFVNRLGISVLIREAMSANSTYELGRLVHRFGGDPVGAFFQPSERPLLPILAPAIFVDQTHDNESPIQRYTPANMLPVSAMTCVAYCAAGSNRGYDEMVPHHINVVTEVRSYMPWCKFGSELKVGPNVGLVPARKALNKLHVWLARNGFKETFVDQKSNEVITVTRHNHNTRESCVLICRTAFLPTDDRSASNSELFDSPNLPVVEFEGSVKKVLLEARTCRVSHMQSPPRFIPNPNFINGLEKHYIECEEDIEPENSKFLTVHRGNGKCVIHLSKFPPGAVAVLHTLPPANTTESINHLTLNKQMMMESNSHLKDILKNISLNDFNFVLFRCAEEDRVEINMGVYDIPRFGPFVYGGLQGIMSVLPKIREQNDMGHPICDNLRQGNWLMEYITSRLSKRETLANLTQYLEEQFGYVKQMPRFLIPTNFEIVLSHVYDAIVQEILGRFGAEMANGPSIVRHLCLATVQFLGSNPYDKARNLTLAAGLPHFSTGYMRTWGRDTFIALTGCLLLTKRFEDAKFIIKRFGATLQNGLIPNLLGDEGVAPRYNARDAVWFWLHSIKLYCEKTSTLEILNESVDMDTRNGNKPETKMISQLVFEALNYHALGYRFRERNAGSQIDSLMTSPGFDIEIGVHWDTGFVFGGNIHNCGTWMDKMGNSDQAGNRGIPATPRDGSAVELVGLCYAVVSWLNLIISKPDGKKAFPYEKVERPQPMAPITFGDWSKLIKENFDRWFFVPHSNYQEPYIQEHLVNKRGIYKDTVGSSQGWSDYQLRPNFAIALAAAPNLPSSPQNAWSALEKLDEVLLGPIGVKTLDPSDLRYFGYYDNSEQSSRFETAGGFSYHQGPEWLWPFGAYACARLAIAKQLGSPDYLQKTRKSLGPRLGRCLATILETPWRGLPELTNANGEYCPGSCPSQAWSISCFLEATVALADAVKIA